MVLETPKLRDRPTDAGRPDGQRQRGLPALFRGQRLGVPGPAELHVRGDGVQRRARLRGVPGARPDRVLLRGSDAEQDGPVRRPGPRQRHRGLRPRRPAEDRLGTGVPPDTAVRVPVRRDVRRAADGVAPGPAGRRFLRRVHVVAGRRRRPVCGGPEARGLHDVRVVRRRVRGLRAPVSGHQPVRGRVRPVHAGVRGQPHDGRDARFRGARVPRRLCRGGRAADAGPVERHRERDGDGQEPPDHGHRRHQRVRVRGRPELLASAARRPGRDTVRRRRTRGGHGGNGDYGSGGGGGVGGCSGPGRGALRAVTLVLTKVLPTVRVGLPRGDGRARGLRPGSGRHGVDHRRRAADVRPGGARDRRRRRRRLGRRPDVRAGLGGRRPDRVPRRPARRARQGPRRAHVRRRLVDDARPRPSVRPGRRRSGRGRRPVVRDHRVRRRDHAGPRGASRLRRTPEGLRGPPPRRRRPDRGRLSRARRHFHGVPVAAHGRVGSVAAGRPKVRGLVAVRLPR